LVGKRNIGRFHGASRGQPFCFHRLLCVAPSALLGEMGLDFLGNPANPATAQGDLDRLRKPSRVTQAPKVIACINNTVMFQIVKC